MSLTDHAASPSPPPPPTLLLWVSRKSGQTASFRGFMRVLRVLVFLRQAAEPLRCTNCLQGLVFTHAPLRSRPCRQKSKGVICQGENESQERDSARQGRDDCHDRVPWARVECGSGRAEARGRPIRRSRHSRRWSAGRGGRDRRAWRWTARTQGPTGVQGPGGGVWAAIWDI